METIQEIAHKIQRSNPTIQLYWNVQRTAIGYWSHNLNRVQVLVGKLLNERWGTIADLLVNDKPLFPSEDWEPIPYTEGRG
jgi:hypothetical protein